MAAAVAQESSLQGSALQHGWVLSHSGILLWIADGPTLRLKSMGGVNWNMEHRTCMVC